jgi:hypothetical protein
MIDKLQIALNAQRRVLIDRVERGEEYSVAQLDGHGVSLRDSFDAL